MSVKRLLLDAGNTRLKWAVVEASRWLERGSAHYEDLPGCLEAWRRYGPFAACHGVNVAGEEAAQAIGRQLGHIGLEPQWLRASAAACGVCNRYQPPERLGADRWAALVGARRRTRQACLVVSVGTAMTVDALTEAGNFIGGVIVPGLQTMRWALARRTAAVGEQPGTVRNFPLNTADAVETGTMMALAGTIDRIGARLTEYTATTPLCLLTGGDADSLNPHLAWPTEVVPELVLEGVLALAGVHECA